MELRKVLPEGQRLNNIDLAKAVISVNNKVRRAAKVSAYEIHTARNADTGKNINLNNKKLRKQQLESRQTVYLLQKALKQIFCQETQSQTLLLNQNTMSGTCIWSHLSLTTKSLYRDYFIR